MVAANVVVVLWGAFVRATGSGAGCGSHWPTCNGEVAHRPESLETFIELTHRLTSGVALLLVVGLLVAVLRSRHRGHPARAAAIATMVLMLLEAAIGAGLVLLELVADNASWARAGWIAVHLVNTFLLLGAMTLTACWVGDRDRPLSPRPLGGFGPLMAVTVVAVLVVGVTGAVTALGDTLFPSASLAEGIAADRSPTAHFLIRLRVWHPVTASLTALLVSVTAVAASAGVPDGSPYARALSLLGRLLLALVTVQLAGGFLNLALLAPVWMQLVHLGLADALWIALVSVLAFRLYPSALGPPEEVEAGAGLEVGELGRVQLGEDAGRPAVAGSE